MVSKTNLSTFAHMTNKKFICVSVTSQNFISDKKIKFFCDSVLAISKIRLMFQLKLKLIYISKIALEVRV